MRMRIAQMQKFSNLLFIVSQIKLNFIEQLKQNDKYFLNEQQSDF